MSLFADFAYPAALIASALFALVGIATILQPGLRRVLAVTQRLYVFLIMAQAIVIVIATIQGQSPVFMTLMYVVAILLTLALVGIGRLGSPEAAERSGEAGRPVLTLAQISKVNGGAAVLVAAAQAVLTWRVFEIIESAV